MPSKPSPSQLPKNWPANLPYLTAPLLSPSLSPAATSSLHSAPPSVAPLSPNSPPGPSPLVKITPISTPTHPAFGQSGLFTTRELKPGTYILSYIGVVHDSDSAAHAASNYDLSLDRFVGLAIDADSSGNEARFINDYRGVAERPNAEFREVWNQRLGMRMMAVWVLPAGKRGKGLGIRKGEEILVSYGRGFWGARRGEGEDGERMGTGEG